MDPSSYRTFGGVEIVEIIHFFKREDWNDWRMLHTQQDLGSGGQIFGRLLSRFLEKRTLLSINSLLATIHTKAFLAHRHYHEYPP